MTQKDWLADLLKNHYVTPPEAGIIRLTVD